MRKLIFCVLYIASQVISQAQATTTITGTLTNPDGTALTGTIRVFLNRSSVINQCAANQVLAFAPIFKSITGGALSGLQLFPSLCLLLGTPKNASALIYSGAGAGGTVSVTGQNYGTLVVNTGLRPRASTDLAITAVARIILSIAGAGSVQCYMVPTSAVPVGLIYSYIGLNSITVSAPVGSALAASTTYSWNWACVQPYQVIVTNKQNQTVYKAQWSVPSASFSPVDINKVDLSIGQMIQ